MADTDLTAAVQFLIQTGTAAELAVAMAREAASIPPSRDQLAAKAMQGILTAPSVFYGAAEREAGYTLVEVIAANAYAVADAMLAEREKGGGRG